MASLVLACAIDERSPIAASAAGDGPDDCEETSAECTDAGSSGASGSSGAGGGSGAAGSAAGAQGRATGAGGNAADAGGGSAQAGAGGAGGAGGQPGACDPSATPALDACVIDEAFGVFVAPLGNDVSGDGSRENPVATLTRAVTVASQRGGLRVYACANGGTFYERLALDVSDDGLALFGGFSCADWSYSPELQTEVSGPGPAALEVTGLTLGVSLENFSFRAGNATQLGQSSIAARIVDSQNVSFLQTTFIAGAGATGAAGAVGQPGTSGASPGGPDPGADADCDAIIVADGPPGATNACGSTSGRGGGTLAPPVPEGGSGGSGLPGNDNGGEPGNALGANGGNGGPGENGAPGTHAGSPPAIGAFSASGYTPPVSPNGGVGGPGQGGGGGAAGNAEVEDGFAAKPSVVREASAVVEAAAVTAPRAAERRSRCSAGTARSRSTPARSPRQMAGRAVRAATAAWAARVKLEPAAAKAR